MLAHNAGRTSWCAEPVELLGLPVALHPSLHDQRLIPRENLADVLQKFPTVASDFLFLKHTDIENPTDVEIEHFIDHERKSGRFGSKQFVDAAKVVGLARLARLVE